MTTQTKTKRWTVYNPKNGSVIQFTNEEFKNLLEDNPVKLKGEYISINMNHPEVSRIQHTQKIWVDAIINSEYFK